MPGFAKQKRRLPLWFAVLLVILAGLMIKYLFREIGYISKIEKLKKTSENTLISE
jgi:hypothetical protein